MGTIGRIFRVALTVVATTIVLTIAGILAVAYAVGKAEELEYD